MQLKNSKKSKGCECPWENSEEICKQLEVLPKYLKKTGSIEMPLRKNR